MMCICVVALTLLALAAELFVLNAAACGEHWALRLLDG
jgi:hypothetical protein